MNLNNHLKFFEIGEISVWLNDHFEELDIGQALQAVSEQRRKEALRYRHDHDRRQSLAAYLLLCEALKKGHRITDPPDFSFSSHGKPVLKDYPDIHFNLSHCREAVLCVTGDRPVGCDVESVEERLDMDLCRYCFNEEEVATICNADHPPVAFTTLWTQKEAYLKLSGEGLTDHLPALFLSPAARNITFHSIVAPNSDYVYTICHYTH